MAADPIALFNRLYATARRRRHPLPDACALATADGRGRPNVRYVLLKGADARGFVFYTHRGSPKGRELEANRHAALAFYWDRLGKQVRVRGRVIRVAAAEADAYWATRPRLSQLGAHASHQSRPVASRAMLIARVGRIAARFAGRPVPRPATWIGYRLVPSEIEVWTRGAFRLHHRLRFRRSDGRWRSVLLQP